MWSASCTLGTLTSYAESLTDVGCLLTRLANWLLNQVSNLLSLQAKRLLQGDGHQSESWDPPFGQLKARELSSDWRPRFKRPLRRARSRVLRLLSNQPRSRKKPSSIRALAPVLGNKENFWLTFQALMVHNEDSSRHIYRTGYLVTCMIKGKVYENGQRAPDEEFTCHCYPGSLKLISWLKIFHKDVNVCFIQQLKYPVMPMLSTRAASFSLSMLLFPNKSLWVDSVRQVLYEL